MSEEMELYTMFLDWKKQYYLDKNSFQIDPEWSYPPVVCHPNKHQSDFPKL